MKQERVFFLILLAAVCTLGSSQIEHLPIQINYEKLSNGLEIIWLKNQTSPLLEVSLNVRFKNQFDAVFKRGAAEIFLFLLRKKSIHSTYYTCSTYTDISVLRFSLRGLAQDGLDILNEFKKIIFSKETIEASTKSLDKIKQQMIHEMSCLQENNSYLASLALQNSLNENYRIPTEQELKKITKNDLLSFYNAVFLAQNVTLVFSGNFTFDQNETTKNFFSLSEQWENKQKKNRYHKKNDQQINEKNTISILHSPFSGEQVFLKMSLKLPQLPNSSYYPLLLLNASLQRLLQNQLGIAYSINSELDLSEENFLFIISAMTHQNNVYEVIEKTKKTLYELLKNVQSQEKIDSAKKFLHGSFLIALSTPGDIEARLLAGSSLGFDPNFLNKWSDQLEKITLIDIQSIATKINTKIFESLTIIAVGNEKKIQENMRKNQSQVKIKKLTLKKLGLL